MSRSSHDLSKSTQPPPPPPPPTTGSAKWLWHKFRDHPVEMLTTTAAVGGIGLVGFAMSRYRICKPNQMLARTGWLIDGIAIDKKAFQLPFQRHQYLDISPTTMRFNVKAMTAELLETDAPVDIVVRPSKDPEQFMDFARYMTGGSGDDEGVHANIEKLVSAALHGKYRSLVAQRGMHAIFEGEGRNECSHAILEHLTEELRPYGIEPTSAQICELDDENGYFASLRQKATEKANFEAEADVARTRRISKVQQQNEEREQQERTAELRQQAVTTTSEQDQIAKTNANTQAMLIAESNATLRETEEATRQRSEVAKVHATMAVREKLAVREAEVHAMERATKEQLLRSTDLAAINVQAESVEREAQGRAAALVCEAKGAGQAAASKAEGEANAIIIRANAMREAAFLEAEGTQTKLEAEAKGYERLLEAYNANPDLARFIKGNEAKLWHEQAKQQAAAVQGLNPEYHVFQTGANGGEDPLLKLVGQVMPVMEMLGNKYDLKLPEILSKE